MDQALKLREKAKERQGKEFPRVEERGRSERGVRVLAITSGKGGVGKTNVTVNLALALTQRGKRVMILDADLGLANIDVLLGLAPRYNISHMLSGERSLSEVLVRGPGGILVLPASSGVEKMTHLSVEERLNLLAQFESFPAPIDFLIIDTGAGISSNVMYFTVAAQHIVVVATSEPTSITDAYAVMKVLSTQYHELRFLLLPNNVRNEKYAKNIYQNLSRVSAEYLKDISIDLLGFIPTDSHVPRAVRKQRAVLDLFPEAAASLAFGRLADRVMAIKDPEGPKGNIQFLWRQILKVD